MYVYKYIYMQICIHAKTIYLVYTHIYCLGFILYATAPLSLSLFGVLFVSFSFFLSLMLAFTPKFLTPNTYKHS